MKYPTRHFGDIRDAPGGSHQEMSYYRAWLDRYAGLKRHIDEIDPKDLCGYDHEVLHCHAELKALVEADRAAEIIELTIYGKWMKPATKIAGRLKSRHPDIAKLFTVLKTLANEKPPYKWHIYSEAVDAFCKMTLCHFGTDAPIDINSYHELEDAFETFGNAVGEPNAPEAFKELKEKYATFVKEVETAEADDVDLFYEDCNHQEEKDLEEIIGNVQCSNDDLDNLEEELRGYKNGYDVLIDWKSDGRNFYDRIDPDGTAMSYTLMGLQWYHMWARNVGPCKLTDLLGRNKMQLEGFIDRLGELFPDTKKLCFKANKAITLYTNFVHDAAQFKADRTATELKRDAKLDSVLESLRNVAYAIKEQEESFMSSDTAQEPSESDVDRYRNIMKAEHEQAERCAKCPKRPPSSEGNHEASDSVINGLMTVCNHLHAGWQDEIKARAAELETQLNKMPKDAPRTRIGFINYCALLYVLKLREWRPYLRGEDSTRPPDIKYGKSYYLNVGEWMKCTILRRLLDPLKEIVKNLPKLNAPTESYPLKELREMFMHIDAIIGMMNTCDEECHSPEGCYLGHTVIAVHRLQNLVCPDEDRPGHVILECQSIAKAYAEFYKRMCNAAWALGFKVENRDKNEIDLDDELRKVIPQEEKRPARNAVTNPVSDELENKQYTEIMHDLKTSDVADNEKLGGKDVLRQVIKEAIRDTPVTVGALTKEGEKAIRKASQRKPGKPASGSRVFSRPKIAKMFGVSPQAVYYWDRGKNAPAGYCEEMRLKGDIEGLIKCLDARNSLKDFLDVLNTKDIIRDGFNEEEVAALNGVLQDMLRRKRNGENILSTIEGL